MDPIRPPKRARRRSAVIISLLLGVVVLPWPAAGAESRIEDVDQPTPVFLEPAFLPESAYLVGEWELRDVRPKHLRFDSGPPPPAVTNEPHDADGVPLQPLGEDGALVYNPTLLAEEGMRYLHGYRKTGKWIYRKRANAIAEKLDEIARIRGKRWQPHRYDRVAQTKGWVNANSHGLVLSFFSRFHRLTSRGALLATADSLLPAFGNRPGDPRWFTLVTKGGYIWFEHWPDGHQKHVLNAHINALFGLYEYWRESGSTEAELLLQGGLKTVRDKLTLFRRRGRLSRYGLSSNWASLRYHHTHISQLRVLAHITGDDWFDRKADQFQRDEAAWRERVRR